MPRVEELVTNSTVMVVDDPAQYDAACRAFGLGIYHHPGWRRAFSAYGLRSHWLVAERDNQPVGLLPLVRQSSALFGRRLISLPWVDETGVTGDPATLLHNAADMTEQLGGRYSLLVKQPLRSGQAANCNTDGRWQEASSDKVLMRLSLNRPSDQLWKDLSAKVRNQVRKADKSGLVTERGGTELVDDFFEVYARNMRDLGSPSHSRKFFRLLVEGLGDLAAIYCTRHEGKPVGAGIVLNNGASLDIPWASSLRDYNRLCVNHGMYWKILSDACEAGYEWFHFGRSTIGSGQHKFKKQWGAEEVPLNWWIYRPDGSAEPTTTATPGDGFGLAQRVWRRLPVWLSKRLGPLVIRHVM